MAQQTLLIDFPLDDVFAVLSDPDAYPDWVVGAKDIRAHDPDWPTAGSVFHHSVGVGPFTVQDNTKSLEADPPHRLVLEARARPFGRARVELVLRATASGTSIEMNETVCSPAILRMVGGLFDPLIAVRNAESLRRLCSVVERRAHG